MHRVVLWIKIFVNAYQEYKEWDLVCYRKTAYICHFWTLKKCFIWFFSQSFWSYWLLYMVSIYYHIILFINSLLFIFTTFFLGFTEDLPRYLLCVIIMILILVSEFRAVVDWHVINWWNHMVCMVNDTPPYCLGKWCIFII